MCKSRIKKAVEESVDKILDKYGVDIKMFSHPVEELELADMPTEQVTSIKKLLIKKINSYEG